MQVNVFLFLALLVLPLTTACAKSSSGISPEEAKYNNCVEIETDKLLDETGSNLESSRASALEACAQLEPILITK